MKLLPDKRTDKRAEVGVGFLPFDISFVRFSNVYFHALEDRLSSTVWVQ